MNAFLANLYTLVIKNKNKRQYIYNLLTNKKYDGGGGGLYEELDFFEFHYKRIPNTYNILNTKLQEQFANKIKELKQKVKNKSKIKAYFYIHLDSFFPFKPLFETMQHDPIFEPHIVIMPMLGNKKFMLYQIDKAAKTFSQYKNVHKCYDEKTQNFIDFTDNVDLLFISIPYETHHKLYSIKYALSKQILPIFTTYGVGNASWSTDHIVAAPILNFCWKIFVSTAYELDNHKNLTLNHGKNAILTGYIKMDTLAKIKPVKHERKKIIIAPHHTISVDYNNLLQLSNFLSYADFFLELYERYPQIDFIFRPHPALVIALAKDEYWGQDKLNQYLAKVKSFQNVEYQEGGEYFESFVNSDGIIHDCGSFTSEYLYTDNPCCFMLKDAALNEKNFSTLGKDCLQYYYQAFNQEDIINFIENVIIKGNDPKKEARIKFAKENIRINYPNVTDKILSIIKEELL